MKMVCNVPGTVVAVVKSFDEFPRPGLWSVNGVFIGQSMEEVGLLLRTAYAVPDGKTIHEWIGSQYQGVVSYTTAPDDSPTRM